MDDVESIIRECEKLGKEIEKTKTERSNLEGRLQTSLERLRKEMGLKDLKEADEELLSLHKEIEELDGKATKLFKKLRDDFEW